MIVSTSLAKVGHRQTTHSKPLIEPSMRGFCFGASLLPTASEVTLDYDLCTIIKPWSFRYFRNLIDGLDSIAAAVCRAVVRLAGESDTCI